MPPSCCCARRPIARPGRRACRRSAQRCPRVRIQQKLRPHVGPQGTDPARIVEITTSHPWSGSRDVAPVVDQLVLAAQASAALGTAAGWKAAADIWAKVAGLKQKLPKAPDPILSPRRATTAEEWEAKFQPKC